ncbi:MAG: ferredoxin [Rhodoglobus sp.]
MIKIDVDRYQCQNYGQCAIEAPLVFQLNEDDQLEYRAEVDDDQLNAVEGAVDVCPMQAIRIIQPKTASE